jgi:type IV pilus assembly protein PilX
MLEPRNPNPFHSSMHSQRGFALLMALIFLALITLLAVGAGQRSLLQQRMAGSLRNAQQARMSAETALRGAEYQIWLKASRPGQGLHCQEGGISGDDGCIVYRPQSAAYAKGGQVTTFRTAAGWIDGIGKRYAGPAGRGYTRDNGEPTAVLAYDPVYLIEDLGSERPPGAGTLHESGNTGPNHGGADEVDLHVYRITARGAGGNPRVVSVVQSTFDAPSQR